MNKKILIVDDDANNRNILRIRLEALGITVIEAVNGQEGLEKAEAEKPDLIILDVSMPQIDGWEVCKRLKAKEDTKKIPVIMLTAKAMEIEVLRGWEAGADEYLIKPFSPSDLENAVKKFLEKDNSQ